MIEPLAKCDLIITSFLWPGLRPEIKTINTTSYIDRSVSGIMWHCQIISHHCLLNCIVWFQPKWEHHSMFFGKLYSFLNTLAIILSCIWSSVELLHYLSHEYFYNFWNCWFLNRLFIADTNWSLVKHYLGF